MNIKHSKLSLLNSSKHPIAPLIIKPENIFIIFSKVKLSSQLKTKTYYPSIDPNDFIVSVFPVPAGPAAPAGIAGARIGSAARHPARGRAVAFAEMEAGKAAGRSHFY